MRTLACVPSLMTLGCTSPTHSSAQHPLRADHHDQSWDTGSPGELDSGDPDDGSSSDEDRPQTDLYGDCFSGFMDADFELPDYDAAGATIGSHCLGTDHQDIGHIERVVFIGDSVTLGTPPADSSTWYRNRLAERLAERYGLEEPDWVWQGVDPISGKPLTNFDGDFGVCAWWGARTDDLLETSQLPDCLPEETRDLETLVVITAGGNDVFKAIQSLSEGPSPDELAEATDQWVTYMREALEWLREPHTFSAPVHVVFANVYEYTDGTGDLSACPGADWAGFGDLDTTEVDRLTNQAMAAYLDMAADTQTDMIFMREAFCGHGFNAGDPSAPCYRGSGADTWFDETCIHPNEAGHAAIADMVMAVIDE